MDVSAPQSRRLANYDSASQPASTLAAAVDEHSQQSTCGRSRQVVNAML